MANQQPTHRAYTVIKRGEGQDDYWLNIGAAIKHEDGDGFNIILQAMPIGNGDGPGKIVLRPPTTDEGDGHTNTPRVLAGPDKKPGGRRKEWSVSNKSGS